MSEFIDLHLHTICSDGTHSPEEVVSMSAEAGLRAVSICDHDAMDGTDEAFATSTIITAPRLPSNSVK